MTKDEIVKSLRACGRVCCDDCVCFKKEVPCKVKNLEAADLIEQQAYPIFCALREELKRMEEVRYGK